MTLDELTIRALSLTLTEVFPILSWYWWLMAWLLKPKKRERFYLLPGMGGRNLHRKRKRILRWSIAAGLFTSAILACILYWMSKPRF